MELTGPRPRLPALTSLRFFAALHVVFFHLLAMKVLWSKGWLMRISSIGYVGVSFFFVLSGFILVYTYAGRDTSPKEFWRARVARIYPAYLFSLLVTAPFFIYGSLFLKVPLFEWASAHFKLVLVLVPLLLQAWMPLAALAWNAVAWSLSDEAVFYIGFPFLLKRILRLGAGGLALVAAGCWILSVGITSLYTLANPDRLQVMDADVVNAFWLNTVKFHPLVRLPEFLLGMACGAIFLKSKQDRRLALPLVLGGIAMCGAVAANAERLPYPVLHTSLLAPAFAAIIYGFALAPRWASVLSFRPCEFLGDASYSLYLLHSMMVWPFFYTQFNEPRHRTYGGIFAYLLLAVSVSGLVYRFIEEPARRKLRGKKKESALPTLSERPKQDAWA